MSSSDEDAVPEVVEATQPGLKGLLECALRSHLRLGEKVDGLVTGVA